MKSPFPGMDPYIEDRRLWKDFHNHLIVRIKEAIADVLPKGYVVRTGARSYIALVEEVEEKSERHFEPDVSLTKPRPRKPPRKSAEAATIVVAEPESITLRRLSKRSSRNASLTSM